MRARQSQVVLELTIKMRPEHLQQHIEAQIRMNNLLQIMVIQLKLLVPLLMQLGCGLPLQALWKLQHEAPFQILGELSNLWKRLLRLYSASGYRMGNYCCCRCWTKPRCSHGAKDADVAAVMIQSGSLFCHQVGDMSLQSWTSFQMPDLDV